MNMKNVVKWFEDTAATLDESFQVDDATAKQVMEVWGDSDKVVAIMKDWLESRSFMGASFQVMLTQQERDGVMDAFREIASRSSSAMDFLYKVPRFLSENGPF